MVRRTRGGLTLIELASGLLFLFVLLVLLMPAIEQPRGEARKVQCKNNLKQIMLALHNYHDTYGSFPPAYVADADGVPMHSWRVLIMPFVDDGKFTQRYDFSEPWNGPNNSKLVEEYASLPVFSCPAAPNPEVNYLAVVGDGTIWPDDGCVSIRDIKDGTFDTIAVVEVHGTGHHWMEPVDLQFDQLSMEINPPKQVGLSSQHLPHGLNVGFADGSVRFLEENTSPQQLRHYLMRDDQRERWNNF